MLTKPLDQITAADIGELCAHGGAYESEALEFKRDLPGERGRADPWLDGGDFTAYARDRLFREVVAFANAQGGTLVLGVAETADNPPRAAAIEPLPRVHDLAARLHDAALACIEPPLPGLQVRAVVTDEPAGRGVVLFRTVPSPRGPHRVASDGHAFIRRGASSLKMTMREIQDLTLDLARGADRLDALFDQRAASFTDWFRRLTLSPAKGFRITAAPVSNLPSAIRVARQPGIPLEEQFLIRFEGTQLTHRLPVPISGRTPSPILRGCRVTEDNETWAIRLDVLDNGVIDLWWCGFADESPRGLYLSWVLTAACLALRLANWVRGLAEAPEWEYGIELEFEGLSGAAAFHDTRARADHILVQLKPFSGFTEVIKLAPERFPRLSWQAPAEEPDLVNLILRDILDAGGVRQPWPRVELL